MSRYIDADALMEWIKSVWDLDSDWINEITATTVLKQTISDIEHEPTADVVEVVRCKDCVNGEMKDFAPAECPYYCSTSVAYHSGRFFCAMGERREV